MVFQISLDMLFNMLHMIPLCLSGPEPFCIGVKRIWCRNRLIWLIQFVLETRNSKSMICSHSSPLLSTSQGRPASNFNSLSTDLALITRSLETGPSGVEFCCATEAVDFGVFRSMQIRSQCIVWRGLLRVLTVDCTGMLDTYVAFTLQYEWYFWQNMKIVFALIF